jgi:predicted transcriptional regulator of viral defense system
MKYFELEKSGKLLLTNDDIARRLSIKRNSAKVSAFRYVKMDLLTRIKRDLYVVTNRFNNLTEKEIFSLANIIQTPSYISLTTALSYYNITTQQQRYYIESMAQKRTKNITIKEIEFTYKLIKKRLYCGFDLVNGYFIATPEKAIFDIIYLVSLKRYNCDYNAIDFGKLNKKIIDRYIQNTGEITKKYWEDLCRTYKI